MKLPFQKTTFVTSCGVPQQLESCCGTTEIVFCGRSNAGKSTLLNKLCGQNRLARVSSTPGKTTTINFFRLDEQFMLVDLPGYGFANRSHAEKLRWAELMEHYFSSGRNIALALVLMDCRHDPSADDVDMMQFLKNAGVPFFAVFTKTDKLKKSRLEQEMKTRTEQANQVGAAAVLAFSAMQQESHEQLRNAISGYFGD